MTSSILETKLPDGRDMLIISGDVYVEIKGESALQQTGQNDDPGLVGVQMLGETHPNWIEFLQQIVIGPKWYELDVKDVVPEVSPANIASEQSSDFDYTHKDSGFAVNDCTVFLKNKRIELHMHIWLRSPSKFAYYMDTMLRINYYVTAVGRKSKPIIYIKGPPLPCKTNLPISGVSASGYQDDQDGSFPPSNATDNSLSTRWSNPGVGSWIRADLGTIKNICRVDIGWWEGNQRQYKFVIDKSTDGSTFTTVFSGKSSGTTLNSEKYSFSITNARYVRVIVNGNTVNNYAHITELDIFGP